VAVPGRPISYPLAWDELGDVGPGDFTLRTAGTLLSGRDRWFDLMPAPPDLSAELIAQGWLIPVACVQAMHEGTQRARARRQAENDNDAG
jgi:DNA primase